MKITTTKITREDKDIDLPYFSKGINEWYCIMGEERCITVIYREYTKLPPSVYIQQTGEMSSAISGEKITAKEFEDAYERAADYLHTEFEKMRDATREKKAGVIVDELIETIKSIGVGEE